MLSRLFWVGIAGVALVTGMILQDGDRILAWGHDSGISQSTERAIAEGIERSVEGGFERMQVIDSEGREIDVPPQTRRAFADAVGRLVKAEADLAVIKVRDGAAAELQAANVRRDAARAEVDRLKADIKSQGQAAALEQDAVRETVRQEVRDQIRTTVREAVRN